MRIYSPSPYNETWNAELSVKDLERALPKVLKAIEKEKGRLTQSLESFPASKIDRSQQLSAAIPKKGAAALLKRMRKLGEMRDPLTRPLGTPIPLEEVRAKIDRLMKERTEHSEVLAQVPAAAEASDEILEHLLRVEEDAVRKEILVLLNLTVRGR